MVASVAAVIGPLSLPKLAERTLDDLPIAHAFQSACWLTYEQLKLNNQRWIGAWFGIGVEVEVRVVSCDRIRL